jgi:hypothetical protein
MKLLLKQIPYFFKSHPLATFFLAVSLFAISFFFHQVNAAYLEKKVFLAEQVFKSQDTFKSAKSKFKKLNSSQDPEQFIKNFIESKSLLEQILLRENQKDSFINFDFLHNKFSHDLKQTQNMGSYKIQHFILKKPVFVDEENLKELITTVEGSPIFPYANESDSPYCYFDFFSMKKSWLSNGNQVYQIFYELVTCQK